MTNPDLEKLALVAAAPPAGSLAPFLSDVVQALCKTALDHEERLALLEESVVNLWGAR